MRVGDSVCLDLERMEEIYERNLDRGQMHAGLQMLKKGYTDTSLLYGS